MLFEERYFEKYDIKVKLLYSNVQLDTVASYIPNFNLFIVDNTASEKEISKAILHELGHLIKHTDIIIAPLFVVLKWSMKPINLWLMN